MQSEYNYLLDTMCRKLDNYEQIKKCIYLKQSGDFPIYMWDCVDVFDAARGDINDAELQKCVEYLKSDEFIGYNDGKNATLCAKSGYSVDEAILYSSLSSDRTEEDMKLVNNFMNNLKQSKLSRKLTTDEAKFLCVSSIESVDFQRYIDIKDNSIFTRKLTDSEINKALRAKFSDSQIQQMINLLDNEQYREILSLSNVEYIIKSDLSESEISDFITQKGKDIYNFLNRTGVNVEIKDAWFGTRTKTVKMNEWLQSFGVNVDDIQLDAFDFLQKLDPEVIQRLTIFGNNGNYIPRLLIKSGNFADVDFSLLSKNADLLNLLAETEVNGVNLLSKVQDVSFVRNKDFDADGMTELLKAFKNTRITQPETNQWNFSLLANLVEGHNSITDVLNSKTIDYFKAAKFLEDVSNIKITRTNGTEWNFADILKEKWLYNSILDEDIDYDKTIQLFKLMANSDSYADMSIDKVEWSVNWLSKHSNDTKYSTVEDYFNAFSYFSNAKTKDDVAIFDGRKGRITQAETMGSLMNVDAFSVESSNFEMLIQLIEDGVVDKHILEYIPKTGKISPAVVEDIDKMYEAYSLGINPKEMFVPSFKNLKEAMNGGNDSILFKDTYKELKIGDVFQVDGEDFIRIKISDTESKMLGLSKDTYLELFPPIERYASTQNSIGNCWELTGINSLLCENDTRASVLNLFSQDGDDIVIKFPNSKHDEIRFENGKLPDNLDERYYSKGALGVQMLEYADGKEIQSEWIDNVYKKIDKMISETHNETQKEQFTQGLADFTKYIEEHQGNVAIDTNNGVHWGDYRGEYDTIFSANRNGGASNELYARLGYENAKDINFYNADGLLESKKLLSDLTSFDKYIISWVSNNNAQNPLLGITEEHAYRIKPKQINLDGTIGTFVLVNPWGVMETELTYQQVLDYGKAIYIAEKN